MSIQNWPKHDRPRERLIQLGAESLSDAELLAIFLRTGLPGKSAVELAREMITQTLSSPDVFEQFVRAHIGLSKVENFLAIALDSQLKVVGHKVLSVGTVNKTAVFPREVLKFAIDSHAPRIMVAHNHPSDCCTPSTADDRLTTALHCALNLVEIELVDHLVVGPSCVFSYRSSGRAPF